MMVDRLSILLPTTMRSMILGGSCCAPAEVPARSAATTMSARRARNLLVVKNTKLFSLCECRERPRRGRSSATVVVLQFSPEHGARSGKTRFDVIQRDLGHFRDLVIGKPFQFPQNH